VVLRECCLQYIYLLIYLYTYTLAIVNPVRQSRLADDTELPDSQHLTVTVTENKLL